MSHPRRRPGAAAVAARGWFQAHKWLLARRASQVFFLVLFLAGPLAGIWIVKGTLASSLTLGMLPLTDPLVALQALLAGHVLETAGIVGALLVLGGYLLIGGRAYCSWVCPLNPVTDLAHWLRARLGLREGVAINRRARLWILGGALLASAAFGTLAWELLNPVTILHRGLVFGAALGGAWLVTLVVFFFDLGVSRRGWCGHLCPVGAFYGLIGRVSLTRVSARGRAACDDCMDCYGVCPEPHVLTPALKGGAEGIGPVVLSGDCTNCGRCIDVCPLDIFVFAHRFDRRERPSPSAERGTGPREAA